MTKLKTYPKKLSIVSRTPFPISDDKFNDFHEAKKRTPSEFHKIYDALKH